MILIQCYSCLSCLHLFTSSHTRLYYSAYTSLPGLPFHATVPGLPVYLFQYWDVGLIMMSDKGFVFVT